MSHFRKIFIILIFGFGYATSFGQVLIPMDYEEQADHLKAYGLVFEAVDKGYECHWLLNHRGGSFVILDADQFIIQKALLKGVSYENYGASALI